MEKDLPSSDSSDEEYVPDVADADLPSEEESDGDDEEVDQKDVNTSEKKLRKRGRRSKGKVSKKIKKADDTEKDSTNEKDDKKPIDTKSEVDKKKYEDDLWASFLGTSSTSTKAKTTNGATTTKSDSKLENTKNNEKISITKVYNFAGEEVKVTKEIPKDSIEARLTPTLIASSSTSSNSSNTSNSSDKKETSIPARGRGRGGLGISAVLGQIGKKSKISTLEKSKLDWDRFKQTEGLSEEIENHNKGKDGYLERQDFLQRTDLRQFEIEKQLRTTRKSNR